MTTDGLPFKLPSPRRLALCALPLSILLLTFAFPWSWLNPSADDGDRRVRTPTDVNATVTEEYHSTLEPCLTCDPDHHDRELLARLRKVASGEDDDSTATSNHFVRVGRPPITDAFLRSYADYVAKHRAAMENITPQSRFLIHRLDIGGLGNRFPGMLSSLILSMLQDRIWLVYDENGGNNGSLFTYFEPATFDDQPLDFNWIPNAERIVTGLQIDVNLTKDPGLNPVSFFPQQHWLYDYDDWTLEDFTESPLYTEPVVCHWSFHYQIPLLWGNDHYRNTLLEWFPTMEAFFAISQLVMRVTGGAKDASYNFFSANFAYRNSLPQAFPSSNMEQPLNLLNNMSRFYVIGIQIRTLKETDTVPPIKHYVDAAMAIWRSSRQPWSKTRIFLATDTASAREEVRSELLLHHKTIVSDCASINSELVACEGSADLEVEHLLYREDSDISFGNIISRTVESDTDGLIDMKLLSMCDDLVVTYGSSFGFVGAAWGGIVPTYVLHLKPEIANKGHRYPDGTRNRTDPKAGYKLDMFTFFFYRALSTEPCMTQLILKFDDNTMGASKASFTGAGNPLWPHYVQCESPNPF